MGNQQQRLAKECARNLSDTDGEAHIIDVVGVGHVAVSSKFQLDRTYYHGENGKKMYFTLVETIIKDKQDGNIK